MSFLQVSPEIIYQEQAMINMIINSVTWQLTRECNYACSYCDSGEKAVHPVYMTTKLDAVTDLIAAQPCDVCSLTFNGGEPTLHPHLVNILKSLGHLNRNIFVTVETNGSESPQYYGELCKGFKDYSFRLVLNLHTGKYSPEQIIEAIKTIKNYRQIPHIKIFADFAHPDQTAQLYDTFLKLAQEAIINLELMLPPRSEPASLIPGATEAPKFFSEKCPPCHQLKDRYGILERYIALSHFRTGSAILQDVQYNYLKIEPDGTYSVAPGGERRANLWELSVQELTDRLVSSIGCRIFPATGEWRTDGFPSREAAEEWRQGVQQRTVALTWALPPIPLKNEPVEEELGRKKFRALVNALSPGFQLLTVENILRLNVNFDQIYNLYQGITDQGSQKAFRHLVGALLQGRSLPNASFTSLIEAFPEGQIICIGEDSQTHGGNVRQNMIWLPTFTIKKVEEAAADAEKIWGGLVLAGDSANVSTLATLESLLFDFGPELGIAPSSAPEAMRILLWLGERFPSWQLELAQQGMAILARRPGGRISFSSERPGVTLLVYVCESARGNFFMQALLLHLPINVELILLDDTQCEDSLDPDITANCHVVKFEEQAGCAAAFNAGMEVAGGQKLAFIDSRDDYDWTYFTSFTADVDRGGMDVFLPVEYAELIPANGQSDKGATICLLMAGDARGLCLYDRSLLARLGQRENKELALPALPLVLGAAQHARRINTVQGAGGRIPSVKSGWRFEEIFAVFRYLEIYFEIHAEITQAEKAQVYLMAWEICKPQLIKNAQNILAGADTVPVVSGVEALGVHPELLGRIIKARVELASEQKVRSLLPGSLVEEAVPSIVLPEYAQADSNEDISLSIIIYVEPDAQNLEISLKNLLFRGSQFEVILIDNGLPDEDLPNLLEFAEAYPKTRILRTGIKLPIYQSLMLAFGRTAGRYILFAHSGQIFRRHSLAELTNFVATSDDFPVAIFHALSIPSEHGNQVENGFALSAQSALQMIKNRELPHTFWGKLISRDALKSCLTHSTPQTCHPIFELLGSLIVKTQNIWISADPVYEDEGLGSPCAYEHAGSLGEADPVSFIGFLESQSMRQDASGGRKSDEALDLLTQWHVENYIVPYFWELLNQKSNLKLTPGQYETLLGSKSFLSSLLYSLASASPSSSNKRVQHHPQTVLLSIVIYGETEIDNITSILALSATLPAWAQLCLVVPKSKYGPELSGYLQTADTDCPITFGLTFQECLEKTRGRFVLFMDKPQAFDPQELMPAMFKLGIDNQLTGVLFLTGAENPDQLQDNIAHAELLQLLAAGSMMHWSLNRLLLKKESISNECQIEPELIMSLNLPEDGKIQIASDHHFYSYPVENAEPRTSLIEMSEAIENAVRYANGIKGNSPVLRAHLLPRYLEDNFLPPWRRLRMLGYDPLRFLSPARRQTLESLPELKQALLRQIVPNCKIGPGRPTHTLRSQPPVLLTLLKLAG